MNLNELLALLPKHPVDVFEKYLPPGKVTENGYYLYEIHDMGHQFYEGHVWVFDSIDAFVDYIPAIVFRDVVVHCEDEERFEDVDFAEDYAFYETLVNQTWDFQQCIQFVEDHQSIGGLELIEFGKISDLVNVSREEYDKCKGFIGSIDEMEVLGLTQGRYQIFHKFHELSGSIPSQDKAAFLEFLTQGAN